MPSSAGRSKARRESRREEQCDRGEQRRVERWDHDRGLVAPRAPTRPPPLVADPEPVRDAALEGTASGGRALLDSGVKADDSPFTTYLVSPYSRHIARFGARHGWTPNAVSIASLLIGLAAALAFAAGTRPGLIAGAVLLQASFTADCVDGQLARYTGSSTSLGAWLDSMFDRIKEYAVYAGLAVGSVRGFDDDVWLLAAAALALQTYRHVTDFAYVASRPGLAIGAESYARAFGSGPRSWLRTANWVVRLPIGERLALISLTAAVWSPRVTFVALLVWGGLGALFALAGRLVLRTRIARLAPK
jgi:phosphatidylglycerophosphate synthase